MRNLIIFDGSNFYHKSKKLAPTIHLTSLNYRGLVEHITGDEDSVINYCVGEIRFEKSGDDKARQMYARQQALFYCIRILRGLATGMSELRNMSAEPTP